MDSHFIFIKGLINNKPLTITSFYALNESQSIFFSKCFDILDRYNSTHTILGGDFNLAAHPALDRGRVVPSSKAFTKSINRSLNKFQLIDSWKAHNVGVKAHSRTIVMHV